MIIVVPKRRVSCFKISSLHYYLYLSNTYWNVGNQRGGSASGSSSYKDLIRHKAENTLSRVNKHSSNSYLCLKQLYSYLICKYRVQNSCNCFIKISLTNKVLFPSCFATTLSLHYLHLHTN